MTVLFRIKKDRFFYRSFFYSVSKSALELKACGITAKNRATTAEVWFCG